MAPVRKTDEILRDRPHGDRLRDDANTDGQALELRRARVDDALARTSIVIGSFDLVIEATDKAMRTMNRRHQQSRKRRADNFRRIMSHQLSRGFRDKHFLDHEFRRRIGDQFHVMKTVSNIEDRQGIDVKVQQGQAKDRRFASLALDPNIALEELCNKFFYITDRARLLCRRCAPPSPRDLLRS